MARREFNAERVAKKDVEPIVKKPASSPGVVANCERLNVRKEPTTASAIINVLNKDELVKVFHKGSTKDFYKIEVTRHRERPLSDEKVEGFCMKNFIKLK